MNEVQEIATGLEWVEIISGLGVPFVLLCFIAFAIWKSSSFIAPLIKRLFEAWIENTKASTEAWNSMKKNTELHAERDRKGMEALDSFLGALRELQQQLNMTRQARIEVPDDSD